MYVIFGLNLINIGLWLLYVSLPVIFIYIFYLTLTKAFRYVGFSSSEAVLIVLASLLFFILELLGLSIVIFGFDISNIYLFSYNNWNVGINIGGGIIPIVISIYLYFKKNLDWKKISIAIIVVAIFTYLITYVDPTKGIVAKIPLAFVPALIASILSVILLYKDFKKAAPFAYISGTIGVLVGADFFHLYELLNHPIEMTTNAVIGGGIILDMIFLTGIIAVIVDGIIMFRQRKNQGIE